ncbi:hypothetical protein HHK36_027282 [Tetracentron sinense]|uniref:ApaG domain-containing protein n=1 Tax=Tetracentron sinense TaxID=13715 RepID=A0A834YL36_TETSI|nr:hypothetical protein HHK36_027282 [Tetracentron sinense]
MGLEELEDLAVHLIISKLGPKDAAILACVNKKFSVSVSDDSLWFKFCSEDLDLSVPEDHLGYPTPSFKVTYQTWRESFRMYPWPLVKRAKKCWCALKIWMTMNFREVGATLRKGASEAEIKAVEDSLEVKLPLPARILYRFCDGQEITSAYYSGSGLGSPLGLIGGYSFYNHLVNVFLLPLSQVIMETEEFVRHLGFSSRFEYIVVAASSTYSEKWFFLNCTSGQLYVGTKNFPTIGEMIPCVPCNSGQQQDAMLLWLEEHGRRLHNGVIKLCEEGNVRSINLFPEALPLCSTAITNGVQVRASAVFVPELSDLLDDSEKYLFSYSIRMRLLPEGCNINCLSYSSCQLYWRRWIIHANDIVVSDVNGEAVVGEEHQQCAAAVLRSKDGSGNGWTAASDGAVEAGAEDGPVSSIN